MIFATEFKAQIIANSLNVNKNYSTKMIYYSFNFTGTYFRVETTLYKHNISDTNRIAYGIKEDESEYQPIHYPPGTIYYDFMNNQNESAYASTSQYLLVINAWEHIGAPMQTITLTYNPPAAPKSDFSIERIQVYRDKFNVNDFSHLFFDSQNLSQYSGTAFNKGTKYKFVVTVNNSGAFPSQNPMFTISQGLQQNGNYPNGNISKSSDTPVAMTNTSLKTIEFYETIITPQDYAIGYLAFHMNKTNTIAESNENNNYKVLQTSFYPASFIIAGRNNNNNENIKIFNAKGQYLKKYLIKKDEKVEQKISEEFGIGDYFIQSENRSGRRIRITK